VALAPVGPAADPELLEAVQALREAGPGQVNEVRAAAEKWIGGVTALFSLFGLAGVTITRDTMTSMSITWKLAFALTVLAAVVLAGLAVFRIYLAAYGWPTQRLITNNLDLETWYRGRWKAGLVRAGHLKAGVVAAGSSLAALIVAVGLLWFAPQHVMPMMQVTFSNGSVVCGTLLPTTDNGIPQIRRATDGAAIDIPPHSLVALTTVSAC
jgi:hypothetical protein